MQTLEFIKDILLAMCIAILLPVTVYWGVSLVSKNPSYGDYVTNYDAKSAEEVSIFNEQSKKFNEVKSYFDNRMFYTSIAIGLITIIIGTLISVYSLSIGLIMGGFLNICMALIFNPSVPLTNFIIFLFLLISLIIMLLKRNR